MSLQVFEIHFNPGIKDDLIFDTFYYEPEDVYEKRLGSLFMLGELKNALPSNQRFLKNLAQTIKTKFYGLKTQTSERALKQTLKKTNDFLAGLTKSGDVSWIANLGFAVLTVMPLKAKYKLNFTKIGPAKILLARGASLKDISQNLEFEEIEPYPLKVFSSVVSGDLEAIDRILIFSEDIFEILSKQGLIQQLAELTIFEEKEINEVLRKASRNVFGACLFIDLAGIQKGGKRIVLKEKLFGKKQLAILSGFKFPIKISSLAVFKTLKGKILSFKKQLTVGLKPKKSEKSSSKLKPVSANKINHVKTFFKSREIKLLSGLILLLVLGAGWAGIEERKKSSQLEARIRPIEEKVQQAENFLILKQSVPANQLFLEAWQEIQSLKREGVSLPEEILSTEQIARDYLLETSHLETVQFPTLLFEFEPEIFGPQNILTFGDNFYFFNPAIKGLGQLKNQNEFSFLESEHLFNQAVLLADGPAFLSSSNNLIIFDSSGSKTEFSLLLPDKNWQCDFFASFKNNLYCLSKERGEIVKYQFLGEATWGEPNFWLENNENPLLKTAKAMIIDSGVWILNEDDSLSRFYAGRLDKTIKLDVFPPIEKLTEVFTSPTVSFFYLLEPIQKRVVIFSKEGQLIKQYQSEAFDDLKDLVVSENGRTIYLLNGLEVYRLDF